MSLTFNNILHILIIFQGFILVLYLLIFQSKQRKSHLLLATILFLLSFQMLGLLLANLNLLSEYWAGFNCVYGFLYGPLFYFYTYSLTRNDFQFKKKDSLHLIPFIVVLIGVVATNANFCDEVIYMIYVVSIMLYLVLSYLELHHYKKAIQSNYSRLEWLNFNWLVFAFILFAIVVCADIFQFASFLLDVQLIWMDSLVYLFILAFINTLYFKGLSQSNMDSGVSQEDISFSALLKKSEQTSFTEQEKNVLVNKLNEQLEVKKIFKDPNLTISQLAQAIDVPKRHLSQFINQNYGQNFVDFINTHRIEEAKQKFENPVDKKETILEVMYDVGFNSKSSFNTAFKNKTGLTPSQFKKAHE